MKSVRCPAMHFQGLRIGHAPVRRGRVRSVAWVGGLFIVTVFLLMPQATLAAFGEDIEKPQPRFTRQADTVTANLVPRGKTASINIIFQAIEGRLRDVQGMDFDQAVRPEVDVKDFRSALFVTTVAVAGPGAQAKLAISSDYFNSSTTYWLFNVKAASPWTDAQAQNISQAERVNQLIVTVKDGGPLDADGLADGSVTIVGGPKDSFWGYAIGTLFIRFFGVFMVLGILQIGMQLSGRFFARLDRRQQPPAPVSPKPKPVQPAAEKPKTGPGPEIDPKQVAALGLAIHLQRAGQPLSQVAAVALALHLQSRGQPAGGAGAAAVPANLWGQQGRTAIMDGRRFLPKRHQPN